jgi:hypothetical protein
MLVDISYAALQVHGIVNVALHRGYSSGTVFFNPKGGSNSIMSKTDTGIILSSKIRFSRGYVKQD